LQEELKLREAQQLGASSGQRKHESSAPTKITCKF